MIAMLNAAATVIGALLVGLLVIGAIGFFAEVPKQLKRIADALEKGAGADDR